MLLGKRYTTAVIVTQVVPSMATRRWSTTNPRSPNTSPGEVPDYVSLEGYVDASVLIAALQWRTPAQLLHKAARASSLAQ
jgi:branched-chain amino acid transport system substrate-binding protein